jgi:capsular polysaccharide biosynthesis protein/Mrp family chromosome partitioning ATPase
MAVPPRTDSLELSDYLGMLRRRWWIVVGVACIGLVAALAFIEVSPKTYTATAAVYVNANAANSSTQVVGGRTSGAVNMDNESQIVQSTAVAALAAPEMHSTAKLTDLLKQVTVTVPANTTILQISCSAASPARAAACAQDFANSYLASRQATAQAKISAYIKQEKQRAAPLEVQAIALQRKIGKLPSSSPLLAADHAALADVSSELAPLRSAIATLSASTNYNSGYVIAAAIAPTTPSSPRKLLYLPSGLLVGLLIGLLAAFVAERRDDKIHAGSDVERLLELPVLSGSFNDRRGLATAIASARSETGQAFTELAQTIASALGDGSHVILVASTSPGPAASVVAANLATTLARIRADVILICANQHYPLSPQLLGVPQGRGLAELIAGKARVSEVARSTAESSRLRVITPGMDSAAALSEVEYDASRRMVAGLRNEVRYVVIEAEGTAGGADTLSLAEFADVAIVVAEVGKTRRSEVTACLRRLERLRTEVLGAVVIPVLRRASGPVAAAAAAEHEQIPVSPVNRGAGGLRPRQPMSAAPEERGARSRADLRADQGPRDF